ncbi:uncharacterized protein [Fopius arisanus]|uniref:Uncharacterized protein n=2 Tax=Fopius arisanus TaxID=64838 RepID=A0A9R1U7V5_9HYME|nr:PREDICTED: uncharacterized protein LOC105271660 [Fopius arisanus]
MEGTQAPTSAPVMTLDMISQEIEICRTEGVSQAPTTNKENVSVPVQVPVTKECPSLPLQRIERQSGFVGKALLFQFFSVKHVLKSDVHGGEILSNYKKSNKFTHPKWARNKIAELVVKAAVKQLKRLDKECFKILATKIVEEFPTEDLRIYYFPPITGNKKLKQKAVGPRGKAPNVYRNLIAKLSLLKKGRVAPAVEKEAPPVVSLQGEEQREWLNVNSEPWDLVCTNFAALRDVRFAKAAASNEDVTRIINQWPIFTAEKGYKLILDDFAALPDVPETQLTHAKWDQFVNELNSIRPIKSRDRVKMHWIELIEHQDTNDDSKVALQIHLLAHNLPPQKKISRRWKPSIPDCQDSMLILTETEESIDLTD